MTLTIYSVTRERFDAIWPMLKAAADEGKTLALPSGCSREEGLNYWFPASATVYVAEEDGQVLGSYYLKPNQMGRGSHVANGGFLVSPLAQGRGVGRAMGNHAMQEARNLGYHAIQYNFVVEDNIASLRIWEKLGFSVIGRIPKGFLHAEKGFVDALILFKWLADEGEEKPAR